MAILPVGKLPSELLGRLINKINIIDNQVILGPALGEDAAVIRLGDRLLVATTDPVTFATDLIGWYAVNISANDIATRGVRPRWFLATVLLPERCNDKMAEVIFEQILSACNSLGVTLVGGHTEVTRGFNRPVVVGSMLGETEKETVTRTCGARAGDDIILTKGIAIEGTAILARDQSQQILNAGIDGNLLWEAANYLAQPGISVVQEALLAADGFPVHAMHDPTESGLSCGLREIATAAKAGILVDEDRIPLLPECRAICGALGINPLGLLSSGALIITLPPVDSPGLLASLAGAGIKATVIGKVTAAETGVKMRTKGGTVDLPRFKRDELARFLNKDTESV